MALENPNAPRLGRDDDGGIRPKPAATPADSVMLEVPARPGMSPADALEAARRLSNFEVDEDFEPVPMAQGTEKATYIVRGKVSGGADRPSTDRTKVVQVWSDTPIAPFRPPPDE